MKKILLILLSLSVLVLAAEADTSSTHVKISDIKYFSLKSSEDQLPVQESKKHLKPFALIQPEDKWFSKDKWMHLTTAYFISIQSHYALNEMLYVSDKNSRNASVGIALSLSLGKEFYDVFGKEGIFSWKDLFYDILGTGLAYYTLVSIK
ncbi:MAG: hypothetical protein WCT23_02030 [Candidatus Neomarinimicrobiota bacterium]|jgi:uncharacterized protein YfiM (DUF2279 family)